MFYPETCINSQTLAEKEDANYKDVPQAYQLSLQTRSQDYSQLPDYPGAVMKTVYEHFWGTKQLVPSLCSFDVLLQKLALFLWRCAPFCIHLDV